MWIVLPFGQSQTGLMLKYANWLLAEALYISQT